MAISTSDELYLVLSVDFFVTVAIDEFASGAQVLILVLSLLDIVSFSAADMLVTLMYPILLRCNLSMVSGGHKLGSVCIVSCFVVSLLLEVLTLTSLAICGLWASLVHLTLVSASTTSTSATTVVTTMMLLLSIIVLWIHTKW